MDNRDLNKLQGENPASCVPQYTYSCTQCWMLTIFYRDECAAAPKELEACEEANMLPNEPLPQPFDAKRCLFCHAFNSDFNANISHMLKTHGFLVPDEDRLRVDLETFVTYVNLVISQYFQCIYCGSERGGDDAVRQHMRAKGHCKVDITSQDSEFRDFYDFESNDVEENGDLNNSPVAKPAALPFTQISDTSVLLESGKILHDRSVHSRHHRNLRFSGKGSAAAVERPNEQSSPIEAGEAKGDSHSLGPLRPIERRTLAVDNQLAHLRAADRRSLLHLPPAQQRSQLAVQKKQMDEARRAQQLTESHVRRKGNKTLMKHFVNDVPGRLNG